MALPVGKQERKPCEKCGDATMRTYRVEVKGKRHRYCRHHLPPARRTMHGGPPLHLRDLLARASSARRA